MGPILDKYGPKITNLIGLSIQIIGIILLTVSFSTKGAFDGFLAGFLLIGFGGSPVQFSHFHLANLFPQKSGAVFSIFTATYGASTLVFKIFNYIYFALKNNKNSTTIVTGIIIAYGILFVLQMIVSSIVIPSKPYTKSLDDPQKIKVSLKKEVFTKHFTFLIIYQCFVLFVLNFSVSTINNQLENLGDTSYTYVSIFNWIYSFSFVFIPVVGFILDTSIAMAYATTSIMWLFVTGLSLIPNLKLQILKFICIGFMNINMWAGFFKIISARFSDETYGKRLGIAEFITSLAGLLVTPVLSLTLGAFKGNFNYPNALFCIFSVPSFSYALFLSKDMPRKTTVTTTTTTTTTTNHIHNK